MMFCLVYPRLTWNPASSGWCRLPRLAEKQKNSLIFSAPWGSAGTGGHLDGLDRFRALFFPAGVGVIVALARNELGGEDELLRLAGGEFILLEVPLDGAEARFADHVAVKPPDREDVELEDQTGFELRVVFRLPPGPEEVVEEGVEAVEGLPRLAEDSHPVRRGPRVDPGGGIHAVLHPLGDGEGRSPLVAHFEGELHAAGQQFVASRDLETLEFAAAEPCPVDGGVLREGEPVVGLIKNLPGQTAVGDDRVHHAAGHSHAVRPGGFEVFGFPDEGGDAAAQPGIEFDPDIGVFEDLSLFDEELRVVEEHVRVVPQGLQGVGDLFHAFGHGELEKDLLPLVSRGAAHHLVLFEVFPLGVVEVDPDVAVALAAHFDRGRDLLPRLDVEHLAETGRGEALLADGLEPQRLLPGESRFGERDPAFRFSAVEVEFPVFDEIDFPAVFLQGDRLLEGAVGEHIVSPQRGGEGGGKYRQDPFGHLSDSPLLFERFPERLGTYSSGSVTALILLLAGVFHRSEAPVAQFS